MSLVNVPDRTLKLLHTSCWRQKWRWTGRWSVNDVKMFLRLLFLTQEIEDFVGSCPSGQIFRMIVRWAVSLLFTRFSRVFLTPSSQRNTDHLQAAASQFCASLSAHWRKNPALRPVTLNPPPINALRGRSLRRQTPASLAVNATISNGINIQVRTTVTLAETKCIVGWWHCEWSSWLSNHTQRRGFGQKVGV